MQKLGTHFIVEFYNCDCELLNDIHYIQENMLKAAEEAGATIVGEKFHRFSPQGVSGAVVLAESHISIHTWPELSYAAVDVFTCGDKCSPEKGVDYLKNALRAKKELRKKIKRGILDI